MQSRKEGRPNGDDDAPSLPDDSMDGDTDPFEVLYDPDSVGDEIQNMLGNYKVIKAKLDLAVRALHQQAKAKVAAAKAVAGPGKGGSAPGTKEDKGHSILEGKECPVTDNALIKERSRSPPRVPKTGGKPVSNQKPGAEEGLEEKTAAENHTAMAAAIAARKAAAAAKAALLKSQSSQSGQTK